MDIKFNVKKQQEKIRNPWNFGVNTCHAFLWTRNDLNKHARVSSKECGFRYVRFHNIISRQTGVYSEDENGTPQINFEKFDVIIDNIIACDYIPYLEISFCPDALSDELNEMCYYKANASVPNSFEKWSYLITKIIEHIIERYGLNFAKKMYFEVWNEPDLPFLRGDMEDYFRLYDYTVTAIKSVNSELRVGGPATSKCEWIEDFVKHIEKGSEITDGKPVPCDFISTHAYPSDLPFLNSDYGADVTLQESNIMYQLFKNVKDIVESSTLKGLPIIMGEWNSSAGPLVFNHDEKNNGAFIIKTCNDLKDIIDGSLYWNMSDIYEEVDFHYIPFHGGYGIINVNDIPKSSFHAFSMLNKITGNEVCAAYDKEDANVRALAAYDNENNIFKILLYYYKEPTIDNSETENITVSVSGIESKSISAEFEMVNDEGGSAYEWWRKIGSPQFINSENLDFLLEKSKPINYKEPVFIDKTNGDYKFNMTFAPGDFALITLKI